MKTLFLIFSFNIFFSLTMQAQAHRAKLDILLAERKELYKEYMQYKNRKSSFWGTQSKEDLKKIISVLKGIINKDDEIVSELNQIHQENIVESTKKIVRKHSDISLRERDLTLRTRDLENEVTDLRKQLTIEKNQNETLIRQVQQLKNENSQIEIILALLLILFLAAAGYIIYFSW